MSDSTSIFSGASRYSSDFQAVVDRSVAIASLPLAQLSAQKAQIDAESQALGRLQSRVDAVRSTLSSLASAFGAGSWSAGVSDPASLRVSAGEGAEEGSHTIEITGLGAYTSTMSSDTCLRVGNPSSGSISSTAGFTLTVDGASAFLTPSANTLSALVAAINASGLDVRAVAVNIGTAADPDYRLSVQSTRLAAAEIGLDDGRALLDTLATGSPAAYRLDGSAIELRSDSRRAEIAPGVSVQFLKKSEPGTEATVSVVRSTSGVSSALGAFCSAYNAAMDELDTNRGTGTGALAGESILRDVADGLRSAGHYSGRGDIGSLAGLGIAFDQNGRVSFDSAAFEDRVSGESQALADFLGAPGKDGFLGTACAALDAIPLGTLEASLSARAEAQQDRLDAEQTRIDDLRNMLVAQMTAADALIASLEQQASYVTNLFEAMRINARTYA